ncbi:hypothetical protein BMF94_6413 [Rhodotorula taiwanensis]|uniref:Uncharacterized protein n=1 Tax=Rhodotorula taiwanensis TaxID=741276 RepID=A0A2S5B142_9BASI|nr:hypothetical protein BMF94_6413 [Rhodotorula taiwanensis]
MSELDESRILDCPRDRIHYTPSGRPWCNRWELSRGERLAAMIAPPICVVLLLCAITFVLVRVNVLRRRLVACEGRFSTCEAALATLDSERKKDRDAYYHAGWKHGRERERSACPSAYSATPAREL